MKICISLSSDFPTVFGANIGPSPNVKKVLFFPISWGKIPNSMVIKLFVKIVHESFFKWTFSHLWPGYLFVWLCKQNTTCKIPGTSAVFWVAWFIAYRTAIKLQKHEIGNYSIWNKFYIKDVYWNKFNIINSKHVPWFTLLDILSIHWELKTENSWWSGIRKLLPIEFQS